MQTKGKFYIRAWLGASLEHFYWSGGALTQDPCDALFADAELELELELERAGRQYPGLEFEIARAMRNI